MKGGELKGTGKASKFPVEGKGIVLDDETTTGKEHFLRQWKEREGPKDDLKRKERGTRWTLKKQRGRWCGPRKKGRGHGLRAIEERQSTSC